MKAFLVGLVFLILLLALVIVGFLLYPFLSIIAVLLYGLLAFAFVIFAIWLLGKVILLVFASFRSASHDQGKIRDRSA